MTTPNASEDKKKLDHTYIYMVVISNGTATLANNVAVSQKKKTKSFKAQLKAEWESA